MNQDGYDHLRESADAELAVIRSPRIVSARMRQAIAWQDYKRQVEDERQRNRDHAAVTFAVFMWAILLILVVTYG